MRSRARALHQVYANEFLHDFLERHPNYQMHKCDVSPALSAPEVTDCWGLMKNSAVIVPIPELRVALIHALDFVSTEPFANYTTAAKEARS